MARSTALQHKAGYIDARPPTASSSKSSCYARPDHTFGSNASVELSWHVGFTPDLGRMVATQEPTLRAINRSWLILSKLARHNANEGGTRPWLAVAMGLACDHGPRGCAASKVGCCEDNQICVAAVLFGRQLVFPLGHSRRGRRDCSSERFCAAFSPTERHTATSQSRCRLRERP